MLTYSGAKWCPKHDVTLSFSVNQTVFPCFYVEISRIGNFSGITFYYTGRQKTLSIKCLRNFYIVF